MSNGMSPRALARALLGATLVAGLLPACGCSDRYPDNLKYGLRTDPLVIKVPSDMVLNHLDPPGDLEHWLDSLKDPGKGAVALDPAKLDGGQRRELEDALDGIFGKPAAPKVDTTGLEDEAVEAAQTLRLDPQTLAEGSQLYRRHCLHCHGITGNGQGPTGPWINPHPRDYRLGKFKFTSSGQSAGTRKPLRADLVRTISHGLEGTAMPAFGNFASDQGANSQAGILPPDEIDKLASYVTHLSLRGQVEFQVMQDWLNGGNLDGENTADYAKERLADLIGQWAAAEKNVIKPGPAKELTGDQMQQSIARGYDLFIRGSAQCISCHADFGRQNNYKFDDWGTLDRPMDLTAGVYRGGRRPIDIYWRIHSGIGGTGMSAFGGALQPDQIWDVVNFVRALPYPKMLPGPENKLGLKDVRTQVYPPEGESSPERTDKPERQAAAPARNLAAQE
ncbi:MAG TPA: c-type cytochrome [Gemmataceae bacterium]|nr:c-type cytochrome [Gemmataceae bacterium]